MNQPTIDLLNGLLWIADKATRPTLPNLFASHSHFQINRQQIHRLEQQGLIRKSKGGTREWTYQLTRSGKLAAMGGRDPSAAWSRKWDNKWRILLFDLPTGDPKTRQRLYRWLRASHFGYLQRSAWISPDPIDHTSDQLRQFKLEPGSVTIIEGTPPVSLRSRDEKIVTASWDFEKIHEAQSDYLAHTSKAASEENSAEWRSVEYALWQKAMRIDPLLPKALLPEKYLGKKIWDRRQKILSLGA